MLTPNSFDLPFQSHLQRQFHRYAEFQVARVLTQMDRDPDSPTFGCCDRNYWHYKIRDFPSTILQQGIFTLEAIRWGWVAPMAAVEEGWGERETRGGGDAGTGGGGDGGMGGERDAGRGRREDAGRGGEIWGGAIAGATSSVELWCVAAMRALCRQVDRWGKVDEYYPFEGSYPAAAFGLYAACRVLVDWQTNAPHLLPTVDWRALRRLTRHLDQRVEREAMNQQAAGLAGLALATCLEPLAGAVNHLSAHADRLFQAQHPEGWFNEYGGPDFGYLTVTLDALVDYHDATQDGRALAAIDRAVEFLARMVGADGRLPSTLNCRNTDYVVPYGLVRTAARNPLAAWLVATLFDGVDQPGHFLWATDDRYHCHYVYASLVRSLPHLAAMSPSQPPKFPTTDAVSCWLPGCGYWISWSADRQWTVYVAARKGGLVRIHQRGQPAIADHGWRIQTQGRLLTSNWWSDAWAIEQQGNRLRVRGQFQASQFHLPTPLKHGVLRLLARVLGERLIPWLKQVMIFRRHQTSGPTFDRTVQILPSPLHPAQVEIGDRIGAWQGAIVYPNPRQNLRHVASADSFSPEEWRSSLLACGRYALEQEVCLQTTWKGGSAQPDPAPDPDLTREADLEADL